MKSNTMFRDQVNSLNSWFEKWNGCEKTVVVYGLLKHLNATQIKFLAQVLQQKDCSEAEGLEAEANNPGNKQNFWLLFVLLSSLLVKGDDPLCFFIQKRNTVDCHLWLVKMYCFNNVCIFFENWINFHFFPSVICNIYTSINYQEISTVNHAI